MLLGKDSAESGNAHTSEFTERQRSTRPKRGVDESGSSQRHLQNQPRPHRTAKERQTRGTCTHTDNQTGGNNQRFRTCGTS